MAVITWGPSLEVGFGDIDVQHRRLVALLNGLEAAAGALRPAADPAHAGAAGTTPSGNGHEAPTRAILAELTAYTQVHFAFEEHLMERHGLAASPRAEAHRVEHRELVAQVVEFAERFEAGDVDLDEELLLFLRDWLVTHILGTDRGLAKALRDAGATSAA